MKIRKLVAILLTAIILLLSSCDGTPTLPTPGGGTDQGGSGGTSQGGSGEGGSGEGGFGEGGGTETYCPLHTDENNDELCDSCGKTVVIILDFYALNDLHGKLDDTDSSVGVDELTTFLRNAYLTDDAAITLSSGDMWQGSSESNLTKGMIITEWMNEIGFVSMTLGNHEFDWGQEYISANGEIADFPLLAINVFDDSTGQRAEYCEASVMVERDGVKIGIIGAIGDCRSSISSSLVEGISFKTGRALTELVKAESDRLRSLGAELIVYSLHDGHDRGSNASSNISASAMSAYYDTALSDGYVDLVFEGHSHQSYVHIDDKGVYHLQNGGYDNGISHVELKLNVVTDEYSVNLAEIVENEEYAHLDDDPIVDELMAKYENDISASLRVVGTNSAVRYSEFIKKLVAQLYRDVGEKKWGDSYNIILGGGFISTRSPSMLPAGTLYYSDLMSVLPFDNEIVLCKLSGINLLNRFINSTNSNYFVSYTEYGEDLIGSINPNATYYVITDTYSSDYAANGLTVVDSLGEGIYARDLLADYISAGNLGTHKLTSIPEINRLANELGYNVESSVAYSVKGKVIEEPTAKYGNTTIIDEDGNTLYIYGIRTSSGGLYEDSDTKLKVGDTVILSGVILNYRKNSSSAPLIEMKNAVIVEILSESDR